MAATRRTRRLLSVVASLGVALASLALTAGPGRRPGQRLRLGLSAAGPEPGGVV